MEEFHGFGKRGRVSFKTQHQLPPAYTNGKSQKAFWIGGKDYLRTTTEVPVQPSYCCQSLDILGSPVSAMEYLSRSWSPAASNFLQLLSNNLWFPLEDGCISKSPEDILHEGFEIRKNGDPETGETQEDSSIYDSYSERKQDADSEPNEKAWNKSQHNKSLVRRSYNLQTLFSMERPHTAAKQQHTSIDISQINVKQFKGWLRGKPLISLLKWHKEQKKEELRLHTAKVDAALSVARLAAAIAGITRSSIIGAAGEINSQSNSSMVACENTPGNVVSFAAALVAAVCAEAAESAGAPKDHVASAINSGFATQAPTDIITLTATAATCLRGAATLRSRISRAYAHESEQLLTSRTALAVVTPSGQKRHRLVSILMKQTRLLMNLAKKCFGAVLTSREYAILEVMEKPHEARGYYLLSLQTDGGYIKLLFQDEKQSFIWMSTISKFLKMQTAPRDKYHN